MATLLSFYDWLSKQKGLRTPVGEMARRAARDAAFPRDIATLEALLEYVRASSNGAGEAAAVARSAYRAYERSGKPPSRG